MPPRSGHRFTAKEHRQVDHIEASLEKRGKSETDAKAIAYATVNKHAGENDATRRYTAKEHRQADAIEASEEKRGKSPLEAKSIAYATVNKLAARKTRKSKA